MAPKGWLTIREAAEELGVSVQRVHQLVTTYCVEFMTVNPRLKLLKAGDVRKLAEKDRPSGVHVTARSS